MEYRTTRRRRRRRRSANRAIFSGREVPEHRCAPLFLVWPQIYINRENLKPMEKGKKANASVGATRTGQTRRIMMTFLAALPVAVTTSIMGIKLVPQGGCSLFDDSLHIRVGVIYAMNLSGSRILAACGAHNQQQRWESIAAA